MINKPNTVEAGLPSDFLWGFATASYQIEGAIDQEGRKSCIWDAFAAKPGKISDGTDGRTACDSYNRTGEDIALLKSLGAKAYRFSIAWPRIIPLGGRDDPVNQVGVDHYIKFVDDLIEAGIVPVVTLYHWDLPQNLDEKYGGLLNKDEFVKDYVRYARVMFEALGSRVPYWITFNEPFCSSGLGYAVGKHAPGRSSDRTVNDEGDSSTEPWLAGHSIMCAHGAAVKMFREEFKPKYGGEIGITLNGDYGYPWDPSNPEDVAAVQRKLEFAIAWFADPIYHGKYPDSMRAQLGDRLPTFTDEEIASIKGSNDFYGMNHYCSHFIKSWAPKPAPITDIEGNLECLFFDVNGTPVGEETQCPWLRPNAPGFRKLLGWISERYGGPRILVTEFGTSIKGENDRPYPEILDDEFRCEYFRSYIRAMAEAVAQDGVNVFGALCWSLMDNYEWSEGYETRFGVCYVDYEGGQTRTPKKSAKETREIFEKYIGKV
ncbi:hypothetical protein PMZ80_010858 [Knufia obscura]|uniref:beta-glucosidase n=2 Tax=Knufia TaxID=430999 RepID=A0AAN8IL14_9EURO|nr:hypothetical protein PMZ80_010858 [Knufia obscura]KAK5951772.1 hypothetical protein OHC33_007064 [Knufia fluminis]